MREALIHVRRWGAFDNYAEMVAAAIMAERERAAKIVEDIGREVSKSALNLVEDQIGKSIVSLASAIRGGS